MNTLVVLTDLGTFKAYRLEKRGSTPKLNPVDSFRNPAADDRIGRQVTDDAGRFKSGGQVFDATQNGSDGERHNMWLENNRRCAKEIAERMSDLLAKGEYDSCYFAASNEINREIVEQLPSTARRKIEKNLHCNLVNAPNEEVLKHFK